MSFWQENLPFIKGFFDERWVEHSSCQLTHLEACELVLVTFIPLWWKGCSEDLVCIPPTLPMSTLHRLQQLLSAHNKWGLVQNSVPHNDPVSWSMYPGFRGRPVVLLLNLHILSWLSQWLVFSDSLHQRKLSLSFVRCYYQGTLNVLTHRLLCEHVRWYLGLCI